MEHLPQFNFGDGIPGTIVCHFCIARVTVSTLKPWPQPFHPNFLSCTLLEPEPDAN
jgi:hypothetical protein